MTNRANAAPGENREKSAVEIEAEYDAEFDVLDRQAQWSADSINRTLSAKYFGRSERFLSLEQLRAAAKKEREAVLESGVPTSLTGSGAIASRVADAAAKLVEPEQMALFEPSPLAFTDEMTRPKFEDEVQYEDFEIAYDLQTSKGNDPEYVVFETISNNDIRKFKVPLFVAKAILTPHSKVARIRALRSYLFPNEIPE